MALFGQLGQSQSGRLTGVGGQHAGAARIGHDCHSVTAGKRLSGNETGGLEQLREGLGADHAGLVEERRRRGLGAGECRGVRASSALTGGGAPALQSQNRFSPGNATGDTGEFLRVTERLQVEQDEVGRIVVFPPLEQVVRGDVGRVADRDEGGDSEAARTRRVEQRDAERAALRGQSQPSRGRLNGPDGGVEVRGGRREPEDVRAEQTASKHAHESQ